MDMAGVCVLHASSSKKYVITGKQGCLSIRHVHVRIAVRCSCLCIGRKHEYVACSKTTKALLCVSGESFPTTAADRTEEMGKCPEMTAGQDLQHNDDIQVVPGECARLRQNVPYVKVHRYNPKHLYPKLNGYGDNGERSLKV